MVWWTSAAGLRLITTVRAGPIGFKLPYPNGLLVSIFTFAQHAPRNCSKLCFLSIFWFLLFPKGEDKAQKSTGFLYWIFALNHVVQYFNLHRFKDSLGFPCINLRTSSTIRDCTTAPIYCSLVGRVFKCSCTKNSRAIHTPLKVDEII